MQYIASDAHKHYTLASVAKPNGQVIREERVEHDRGALRQFLDRCEQEVPSIQYRRPRSNVRSRPEYEYALLSQLRLAYRVQSALHPLTFAPVPPVPGAWTFARLYSESHTVSS